MSDLSISNAQLVLNNNATTGVQSVGTTTDSSPDSSLASAISSGSSTTQAASVDISKPGELFSKLQKLKAQDPDKYKQVVSDLADKLKTAASSATGKDQEVLNNLASKFQDAANGGDLTLGPPANGAGSPKGAAAAYAQNSSSTQQGLSGVGHHKGGHHHQPSAAVQQAFKSISGEVDTALGATSDSSSQSATTAVAA